MNSQESFSQSNCFANKKGDKMIIKDEILNEKYDIDNQKGICMQSDYFYNKERIYTKKDESNRFILIDLWQIGIVGAENCNGQWDKNGVKIVTEKDIDEFVQQSIDYINEDLFFKLKENIINEIKEDNKETIILNEKK